MNGWHLECHSYFGWPHSCCTCSDIHFVYDRIQFGNPRTPTFWMLAFIWDIRGRPLCEWLHAVRASIDVWFFLMSAFKTRTPTSHFCLSRCILHSTTIFFCITYQYIWIPSRTLCTSLMVRGEFPYETLHAAIQNLNGTQNCNHSYELPFFLLSACRNKNTDELQALRLVCEKRCCYYLHPYSDFH